MLYRRQTNHDEHSVLPPTLHEALHSPGQPIGLETRSFMKPRFGYDFSRVRGHTDEKAEESAEAVSALASKAGRDMVFDSGGYAPYESKRRWLIACPHHGFQQRCRRRSFFFSQMVMPSVGKG